MSRETVEVVRGIYDEWGRGNFRAGGELWDRRAVFVPVADLPDVGEYVGPERIAEFMRDFLRPWATYTIAADELIEAGDSVVVTSRQRGVGRGSGIVAELGEQFHVWTFRGRKVILFEAFGERDEALEAVGLPADPVSRENVELAHRFYDAVNRRDLDAWLAVTHEDAELISILVSVEGGYHGHEGFRRWWENVLNAFPDYTIEVQEVRDLRNATLAAIRLHGHGSGSGAPIDQSLSQVIEWRDGKAVRVESFRSEREALEAVGVSK